MRITKLSNYNKSFIIYKFYNKLIILTNQNQVISYHFN